MLVTDHQNAGRGRQSRTWVDEPGRAALMSVLLRPATSVASLIPLVAGLAVTDALNELVAEDRRIELKWPNDVIVPSRDDRKLAGILAEAVTDRAGGSGEPRLAVVVGMGMNLAWGPSGIPTEIASRAIALAELTGADPDRWEVVGAVLQGLDRWLGVLEGQGPEAVLGPYRARCVTLGRPVRFQTPTEVVEGIASHVAPSGALVVERDGVPIELTAGDAHHL